MKIENPYPTPTIDWIVSFMFYVYALYEIDSLNPFYIGKGKGDRLRSHFEAKQLAKQTPFYKKLRSMLLANRIPIMKILFKNLTEQEAFDYEIILIALYGRRDLGTGCLFNMTNGGEGLSGHVHSTDSRAKMSASHKGVSLSPEHARNIGLGHKGTSRSFDSIYRSAIKRIGSKHSIGAKAKMKRSALRRAHPIESYNLLTGEIVKQYESIVAAHQDGFDRKTISGTLEGKRHSCGGLGWRHQQIELINPTPPDLTSFPYQPFD